MKQDNKIFYETLLDELKGELIDLIHRFKITRMIIRPRNFRPKIYSILSDSTKGNAIDIYRSKNSIFIEYFKSNNGFKLFEINLLESDIGMKEGENVYRFFCNYFQKLIEEIKNDRKGKSR